MDDFLQIFNQIAHAKEFGFNPDFLEANVINIALLLSGLIYILKNFLGSTLINRQEKVLLAIQESEERLKQANERLAEAEKQLTQTQLVVEQIKQEAEKTAQKVRDSILNQGKIDIEKLTAAGKNSIANAEQQIKKQIQQQIATLAIHRVTIDLEENMSDSIQLSIIDNNINKLGSKL
uniref:ATP synthase subunit b, chloroplastic n=2 Tax=Liagora TaxID=31487 RepID=A0A1G4NZW1_9FLOR|nr:ATP synthase CF0 subunit I [Liagora harveyana]YP_009315540.1 ATP synthase CF0 subunit I [Liagora brachyclada]SCW22566.1 ATP synthase CF0 subunit I [Liagora harveyana]SCW24198.1 ATP synthase CF0 subunit I [Liagora brachyclada]